MKYVAFALAVVAASGMASAQTKWVPLNQAHREARQQQAQTAVDPSRPPARFLPAGTLVSLSPLQEISSKHMTEGQRFPFVVVEDVLENGGVVIPRGSSATAVVTAQTGRAIGGKSGKFDISFENVVANGVRFPLTGVSRQEGKGNTMGALFGLIFISGRSATLLPGEVVKAFTSERTAY